MLKHLRIFFCSVSKASPAERQKKTGLGRRRPSLLEEAESIDAAPRPAEDLRLLRRVGAGAQHQKLPHGGMASSSWNGALVISVSHPLLMLQEKGRIYIYIHTYGCGMLSKGLQRKTVQFWVPLSGDKRRTGKGTEDSFSDCHSKLDISHAACCRFIWLRPSHNFAKAETNAWSLTKNAHHQHRTKITNQFAYLYFSQGQKCKLISNVDPRLRRGGF